MHRLLNVLLFVLLVFCIRAFHEMYQPQTADFNWKKVDETELRRVAADYERQKTLKKSISIDNFYNQLVGNNTRLGNGDFDISFNCEDSDSQCIGRGHPFPRRLKVSLKEKVGIFLVHKSFSSVLESVACYLERTEQFERENRHFAYEFGHVELCRATNRFEGIADMQKYMTVPTHDLNNWKFLMITRDPTQRLVSGFLDQCVRWGYCLGCEMDLKCFLEALYIRMKDYASDPAGHKLSHVDLHFFPQNWRCDLETHAQLVKFVKYSTDPRETAERLVTALGGAGVPDRKLSFIYNEITGNQTIHSTKDSRTQQFLLDLIRGSTYLQQLLVKMFYYDYVIFDYNLPFAQL